MPTFASGVNQEKAATLILNIAIKIRAVAGPSAEGAFLAAMQNGQSALMADIEKASVSLAEGQRFRAFRGSNPPQQKSPDG